MSREIVYLGHDNRIDLILRADGSAVSLSSVTNMTLTFGDTLVESDNGDSDPITWSKTGYRTGEVRLTLGEETITPGVYKAPLIVYDATYTTGLVWGMISIEVVADPEAEAPAP